MFKLILSLTMLLSGQAFADQLECSAKYKLAGSEEVVNEELVTRRWRTLPSHLNGGFQVQAEVETEFYTVQATCFEFQNVIDESACMISISDKRTALETAISGLPNEVMTGSTGTGIGNSATLNCQVSR